MFKAAEALGGAILFFDELDALGGTRADGNIHEVSRRMLSVLLRYGGSLNRLDVWVIGMTPDHNRWG